MGIGGRKASIIGLLLGPWNAGAFGVTEPVLTTSAAEPRLSAADCGQCGETRGLRLRDWRCRKFWIYRFPVKTEYVGP